jgi:cis-L-3-hydroxyproline dehydratase
LSQVVFRAIARPKISSVRVAGAVRDVDVYMEQPCFRYEECLAVRRHTDLPFILDEVVD